MCAVVVRAIDSVKAREQIGIWDATLGLSQVQALSPHFVHFLSNLFNDCTLF